MHAGGRGPTPEAPNFVGMRRLQRGPPTMARRAGRTAPDPR